MPFLSPMLGEADISGRQKIALEVTVEPPNLIKAANETSIRHAKTGVVSGPHFAACPLIPTQRTSYGEPLAVIFMPR